MTRGRFPIRERLALALAMAAVLSACPPAQQGPPPARPLAPPPTPAAPPPSFPERADEGEVSLLPGFAPTPYVVVGETTASRLATEFNAPCPVYIAGAPEYFLDAPQGHRDLTLLVQSAAPVGLMVMSPDGNFLCSEGASGMLRNQFPPGRYAIWVGATAQGGDFFYRLGFSEDATVTPAALPDTIMGKWVADGEAITLSPGFDPDPHVVQGTTRGAVSADALEMRCNGFLPDQPSHLLELTADFPRLKILVRHNRDTALIVTDARGRVWCEDDVEGRFPIIEDAFPRGHYRIFVATKNEGGSANYSLGFSVADGTTVQSLPRAPTPAAAP
ncbi:MAG: hypothetical protein JRH11_04515 [Deltaproteobacteria bacterium]|nr:hypothetical protein [Deltaproteobacteria bacterium]